MIRLKFKNDVASAEYSMARPVLSALRPKAGVKLADLVDNGTLERVESTEWVIPLAYIQVELQGEHRKCTATNRHKGVFKYTRVLFVIGSELAIFQRIMETALASIEGALVYLDDIAIIGQMIPRTYRDWKKW
ncbi:unnamed protein product [Heligmosomoides polygyrus]|uniref:Reverse transcriptase domain-containing protein n=1 Tax=Heligmosomoides polygyrus TaxID=6339 RepID=A0A183FRE5_HELPZ|nr:unnamed protein product [Heligmosomoides polygyrus]